MAGRANMFLPVLHCTERSFLKKSYIWNLYSCLLRIWIYFIKYAANLKDTCKFFIFLQLFHSPLSKVFLHLLDSYTYFIIPLFSFLLLSQFQLSISPCPSTAQHTQSYEVKNTVHSLGTNYSLKVYIQLYFVLPFFSFP